MISLPKIQIQQQFAKIGMSIEPGYQTIKQPPASFDMKTTHPKMDIHSPQGELTIDQSRAWDALSVGGNLQTMNRIYTRAERTGLEGIGKIVQKGNRLAAILEGGNPIASMARQQAFETANMNHSGPASVNNVDVNYAAQTPDIQVIEEIIDLNIHMNRPEIHYNQGRLQYQMLQHASVEIIPPQMDTKI